MTDLIAVLVQIRSVLAFLSYMYCLRDHITPVLRQLHWLPVRQRVNFKLAVLVLKALHGLAPCYLVDGRRRLRSSDAATCVLQRTSILALAIGRSESQDHLFGTVSPLNSANLIYTSNGTWPRSRDLFFLSKTAFGNVSVYP